MLSEHADRVCTFFAVDFEPHFGVKLGSIAEEIYAEHKPTRISVTPPVAYNFAWPEDRILMILGFQRIAWQTLGLSAWQKNLKRHSTVMKSALEAIGAKKLNRIGFKVQAFLPLSMSHAELSQLMFGSFLVPAEELQDVCGEVDDPLVQIQGKSDDLQYSIVFSAMNSQQITEQFMHVPNLEHFRSHKFLDTIVKGFHDGIAKGDCFYLDIDLFQRDVSADALGRFIENSLNKCDEIAGACVRRLKTQPAK